MPIAQVITGSKHPVKVWTNDIDENSTQQLMDLANLPFIFKHVASMPDVHHGIGSCVGTVIATRNAIIPAAVGVDIGCGMMAQQLKIQAHDLPDNLAEIRSAIEAAVPHGRTDNGGVNDRGAWGDIPESVSRDMISMFIYDGTYGINEVLADHPKISKAFDRADRQLGTLGTGNHFIELCLDQHDGVWVMLHSGSRGVGNSIGRYFIEKAKEEMERWSIALPNPDCAYLPKDTQNFRAYWTALEWAQRYAEVNRKTMMQNTLRALSKVLKHNVVGENPLQAVNCHHNYATLENHFGQNVYITRKGAVRARVGDLGIIPGSMGAKSYIVEGLGNPDSFHSCSHGAGRRMSRGEARRTFTKADLIEQTAGIECRKDEDVIDEIPGAYKSIDEVMANQTDLIKVKATLHQIVCVKG